MEAKSALYFANGGDMHWTHAKCLAWPWADDGKHYGNAPGAVQNIDGQCLAEVGMTFELA